MGTGCAHCNADYLWENLPPREKDLKISENKTKPNSYFCVPNSPVQSDFSTYIPCLLDVVDVS